MDKTGKKRQGTQMDDIEKLFCDDTEHRDTCLTHTWGHFVDLDKHKHGRIVQTAVGNKKDDMEDEDRQMVICGLPMTVRLAMEGIPLASALIWQVSSRVTSFISRTCFFPSTWVTTVLLGWILTSFLYQVTGMFSWESSSSNRAVLPSFTVWSFIGEINLSLIPKIVLVKHIHIT